MNIPTTPEITNIVLVVSITCAWITIILQGMSIRRLRKSLRATDKIVVKLVNTALLESISKLAGMIFDTPKPCADCKKPEPVNDTENDLRNSKPTSLSPLARVTREQIERKLKGEQL